MATGSLKVDFQANTDELDRLRQDFANLAEELETLDIIEALAEHARGQIIKRTQEGKEHGGGDLAPYSDHWREKRERAGLPGAPVNLTVTGTMLDAIDFDVKSPTLAEIYVRPDTDRTNDTPRDVVADAHQNGKRPWFGLGDREARVLEREWIALTLSAMLRRITDARPIGSEISQLGDRPTLVTEPAGPFADYDDIRRG